MGAIKQGGWSYTLTAADKLWAARMVEGEGPLEDAPAVLWTMTQLFAPAGQRAKYGGMRYRTFADLIRAYSQPINPRWAPSGDMCSPGGRGYATNACSVSRLERRAELARAPYSSLDPAKRAVVERWFKGNLPNPVPGAIEFAAPNVSRSFLASHPGWSKMRTPGLANWYLVPPRVGPRVAIAAGGAGLLLLGGGVALAWFGGRWLRRRRQRA